MSRQPRALRLASPFMHGPDVAHVQRLLGVPADGEYGPITADAVSSWKRSKGEAHPAPDLSPADQRRLLQDVRLRAVSLMERWAAKGLRERPLGSDRVPGLVALAGRLGVAPGIREMGYPWCAFAAFLPALQAGGVSADLGLRHRAFNALYAPAVLTEAGARRSGLWVVQTAETARGDLVLFDWDLAAGDTADHVARLVRAPWDGRVATVDGNSGEGVVALRERPVAEVRAFVRDS